MSFKLSVSDAPVDGLATVSDATLDPATVGDLATVGDATLGLVTVGDGDTTLNPLTDGGAPKGEGKGKGKGSGSYIAATAIRDAESVVAVAPVGEPKVI